MNTEIDYPGLASTSPIRFMYSVLLSLVYRAVVTITIGVFSGRVFMFENTSLGQQYVRLPYR